LHDFIAGQSAMHYYTETSRYSQWDSKTTRKTQRMANSQVSGPVVGSTLIFTDYLLPL